VIIGFGVVGRTTCLWVYWLVESLFLFYDAAMDGWMDG
jgi:hypothetical protein